jgi:hypothetical protein
MPFLLRDQSGLSFANAESRPMLKDVVGHAE